MSNLNVLVLFLAVLSFTACQKESLSELDGTTPTTKRQSSELESIFSDATTDYFADLDSATANSRNSNKQARVIKCGQGPINSTTIGQSNYLHQRNMPCGNQVSDDFTGPDAFFLFHVRETPNAIETNTITLSNLKDDLDLFVYTLDSGGKIKQCKAVKITYGFADEVLHLTDLPKGCYLIVVDGYTQGVASDFNIELTCSAVSANPPSGVPSTTPSGLTMIEMGFGSTIWKVDTKNWIEQFDNGDIYTYEAMKDNENELILEEKQHNFTLRIDLQSNEIFVKQNGLAEAPFTTIQSTSSKLNAYLVNKVTYADQGQVLGTCTFQSNKKWIATPKNSTTEYEYQETNREGWVIFLKDVTYGDTYVLDLRFDQVLYVNDQRVASKLYDIVEVE
ncbi:MAG: hypothetical protein AAGJ18_27315 [Bacteroidota bacterium]